MNERIKELIKQAGDYVNEVYTPPVRSKTPGKIWEDGHIDWLTQFNKKFAELIVQECVSVINTEAAVDPIEGEYERMWKMGTEFAVDQIKKHFGVEE